MESGGKKLGETQSTVIAAGRAFHEAVAHDGMLWVFLGLGAQQGRLADIWTYDPAANTWEEVNPLGARPSGRAFHSAAIMNGRLWMVGGLTQEGPSSELWSFDLAASTWESHTAVPDLGLAGHSTWAHDNKLYVFGGQFTESGGTKDSLVNVVMPDRGVSEDGSEDEEEELMYPSDDSSGGEGHSLVNVVMPDRGVSAGGNEDEEEDMAGLPSDDSSGDEWHGLVNVVMPDRGVSSGDEEEEEEPAERPSDESADTGAGHGLVNVVMPDRGVGQLWVYDSQADSWDQSTPEGGGPSDRNLHASAGSDSTMWVFGGQGAAAIRSLIRGSTAPETTRGHRLRTCQSPDSAAMRCGVPIASTHPRGSARAVAREKSLRGGCSSRSIRLSRSPTFGQAVTRKANRKRVGSGSPHAYAACNLSLGAKRTRTRPVSRRGRAICTEANSLYTTVMITTSRFASAEVGNAAPVLHGFVVGMMMRDTALPR